MDGEKKIHYKYCVVPCCRNTTSNSPTKLFFYMPRDPKKRKAWTKAMRRDDRYGKLSSQSSLYCCEDHFTLEEDMENYWRWNITKDVKRLQLKSGVIPRHFECQKRQIASPVERKASAKRQRKSIVTEALSSFQSTSSDNRKAKLDSEMPSTSSAVQLVTDPGDFHMTSSDVKLQVHFEESQFEQNRADRWKKLKQTAIPTLFDVPNPPPVIGPLRIKGIGRPKPGSLLHARLTEEPQRYQLALHTQLETPSTTPVFIKEEPIDINDDASESCADDEDEDDADINVNAESEEDGVRTAEDGTVVWPEHVSPEGVQLAEPSPGTTHKNKCKPINIPVLVVNQEQSETSAKKRRLNQLLTNNYEEDDFDTFSRLVANQLRQLPLERALWCQNEIHSLLIKERIEYLSCLNKTQSAEVSVNKSSNCE